MQIRLGRQAATIPMPARSPMARARWMRATPAKPTRPPSAGFSTARARISWASRVFPTPALPTMTTSDDFSTTASISSRSSSRPMRGPSRAGQLTRGTESRGTHGCRCSRRSRVVTARRNRQVQAVAESRHRADRARAEHAPEARDLRRKVVLIDDEAGPDPIQQRRFRDEAALVFHQHEQEVECPRAELDRMSP